MIRQRTKKDIWQGLYEFPMIETEKEEKPDYILRQAEKEELLQKENYEIKAVSPVMSQQLSHQLIKSVFITIKCKNRAGTHQVWAGKEKLSQYAFPLSVKKFIEKEGGLLF